MSGRRFHLRCVSARRAGVALAALLGYVFALGGTAVGEGWQLLAHVATQHHAAHHHTPARPLVESALERHHEDDHAHPHAPVHRHHPASPGTDRTAEDDRTGHAHPPEASGEADRFSGDDGLHAHGGELHRHDAPADDPAPVVVSVDDHRLPLAVVLAHPAVREAGWGARGERVASVEQTVETPPPIARG